MHILICLSVRLLLQNLANSKYVGQSVCLLVTSKLSGDFEVCWSVGLYICIYVCFTILEGSHFFMKHCHWSE